MGDVYRLVFKGEVLEGQHPAVVRKRLAKSAGFADGQLDTLFSGRPVVLKREADTSTAARIQAVFKNAGARLRVLPVEVAGGEDAGEDAGAAVQQAAAPQTSSAQAEDAAAFELLPAGTDRLDEQQRTTMEPREMDTSALALERVGFAVPEPGAGATESAGPDVSHLTVAAVGTDLSERHDHPTSDAAVPVPEFVLADVGADLGVIRRDLAPQVDVSQLTFEVAAAGSDLGQRRAAEPPPAPDISHLSID